METTFNNQKTNAKVKILVFTISSLLIIFSLACFIFHTSPAHLFEEMAEFSRHHYFLAGLISLLLGILILKFYYDSFASSKLTIYAINNSEKQFRNRRKVKVAIQNLQRTVNPRNTSLNSIYIDKNEIVNEHISSNEVLTNTEAIEKRKLALSSALTLGNLYKQKVSLIFNYKGKVHNTLVTIWHLDDGFICIKGGTIIPIKSIYDVKL